jgi:hypothetical protein
MTCGKLDLAFLLVNFLTFRACTSWYKLVQACTSSEKFFVDFLMLHVIRRHLLRLSNAYTSQWGYFQCTSGHFVQSRASLIKKELTSGQTHLNGHTDA